MPKVKLSTLVLDYTLYPRHHISEFNVNSIMRALRAGFAIPPVIADRKTKKVTDGFNRCESVGRVFGPDADIEVEWRDYKNEAAMFEDAMALNTAHGEKLNSYDMARCAIIAQQLGIQEERLAACLHATVSWLENLRTRKIAEGPDGPMPLKGTLTELAKRQNAAVEAGGEPKPLTAKQVHANEGSSGVSWWFLLDKAIHALRENILPLTNQKAVLRVQKLHDLSKAWLERATKFA